MTHHRIAATALAALFALGSSAATLAAQAGHATPALAAARDDEDHHDNDHHDNGKHNGWYKHHHDENDQGDEDRDDRKHHAGIGLSGRIVSINGNALGVQLSNGNTVYVNDAPALNAGRAPNLYVGEYVRVNGGRASDGTFYANSIAQTNGYDNGYNNGYYNGYGSLSNIVGYEISGVDGNGNFQLRTGNTPIAGLSGTTYTVHIDGNTRVDTGLGNIGQRVRVIGRVNGGTILATQITN